MSATIQTQINFKVRKSCRNTPKVNYDEKAVPKTVIIGTKCLTETKPRGRGRPRVRRHSVDDDLVDNVSANKPLDENESTLRSSPTKIKKTSKKTSADERHENISVLSKTKQLLSPSIVDSVVGRDAECQRIGQLLTKHLESKRAVSLYISGSAGTGKTLSVTHVTNQLAKSFDFKLITINCMSFRNSNSIYNKILTEFNHKKQTKQSDCLQTINGLMSDSKSNQMVVIILDEIDQLLESKSHDVLNTIFLWTKLPKSRLILVGIANALDFTTRVLSRIKAIGVSNIEEFHFTPYNTQQIAAIIEDRIKRASDERNVLITPLAVQLCARKISSCSGDIRKALDVCRRALDLIQSASDTTGVCNPMSSPLKLSNDDGFNAGSPKKSAVRSAATFAANACVDVPQIMSVLNRVYGQKLETETKKFLPFNQQIILCALLVVTKHKCVKEVKLSQCLQTFVTICAKRGISYNGKSEGEFLSMCQLLSDYGFIEIKGHNQTARNAKLSLKVDDSEIRHTLSDTLFLNAILQQSASYVV